MKVPFGAALVRRGASLVNPRRAPSKAAGGPGRRARLTPMAGAPKDGGGARFRSNATRFHRST
jgi:hypothetical protein